MTSFFSYFKHASLMFLLIVIAVVMTACAGKKPIQTVAEYGAKAAPIAVQAQNIVLEADRSGLQPNKDLTAKSMAKFKELGQTLQKLASALEVYDTLDGTSQYEQGNRIRQLLSEARTLTRAVMVFTGGNEALADSLNRTFDNLDRLFDAITAGLAPLPVQ